MVGIEAGMEKHGLASLAESFGAIKLRTNQT